MSDLFEPVVPDKDKVLARYLLQREEVEISNRVVTLQTARSKAEGLQKQIDALAPDVVVDGKDGYTKVRHTQLTDLLEKLDKLMDTVKTFEDSGDIEPLREVLKTLNTNFSGTLTVSSTGGCYVGGSSGGGGYSYLTVNTGG